MFSNAVSFLSRLVLLAVFALVVGAISSLSAICFVTSIAFLNDWLLISPRSRMMLDNAFVLNVATVCIPAVGGLVVGLLWQAVKERRPLGPPDAIYAVHTNGDSLSARSGLLSTLGSVISLGCGASVGQYGPLVLMGSTIGSWSGNHLKKLSISARELGAIGIGCGAAAVIATAFNAPIAGLVFAHEVILRHYSIRAFAPVTVAATVGYVIANGVFQLPPIFRIDAVTVSSPAEYLVFVAIGIGGALIAVAFMRAIILSGKIAQMLPVALYWRPAIAGALLGTVAISQPEILGVGSDLLRFTTIDGAFTLNELTLLLLLKISVTALCIGFGFAGGVFSPALLIGALFGALVSLLGHKLGLLLPAQGDPALSSVAIYAVCGMVAVTSPVIGAPLTTILVVFELTRNYDLALACMTSVVFANLLGYRLFGRSLFDVQLKARGIDLSLGRDKTMLELTPIGQYLSQNYSSCRHDANLQQVCDSLVQDNRSEAYIVDDSGRYIGTVTTLMILKLQSTEPYDCHNAGVHAVKEDLIIDIDTTVLQAMNSIKDFVGESVPVIDKQHGDKLLGVIYEADLVTAYLDTITLAREQEHAGA